jgi:PAS domain S-box-containing protein
MLNENVTIVIIEDEVSHAEAIRRNLVSRNCTVLVAFTLQEYRKIIEKVIPSLVFTDMNLPDGNAFDILESVSEKQQYPIVIMTSFGDESIAVQAIKSGAIDYIVKSESTFNEMYRIAERTLREWQNSLKAKLVEQELRNSEARFRALVENAPEAIVLLDVELFKFIDFNDKASRLFNYTRNELLLKSPVDLSPIFQPDGALSKEQFLVYIQKAVNGENLCYEWMHINSHGEEIPCEVYLTNLPATKGTYIRGSIVDITERKKVEQELLKAKEKAEESDRLKSAFLANVSHEIRTPMNGILGFAEFLRVPDLPNETKNKYIDIINSCSKQLLGIITDIIEISKIETNQFKIITNKINVNTILNNVYINLKITITSNKNVELKLTSLLPESSCMIISDETKLQQIISNIVENALKFTDTGSVEFGCKVVDDDVIEFFVKDTGIGIPADYQKIVFERFRRVEMPQTESRGGTGLGLAICKSYVEILGGKIWLESEEGKGTTFYFTIPSMHNKDEIIAPIVIEGKKTSHSFKDKMILVVEDDDINFLYLQEILSKSSATFIRAKNGRDAINILSNTPSINLVLMDIKMPVMSGIEATIEIRKFNKNVPIIAQTAYAFEEEKQYALNIGCNDYISKPIKRTMLISLIEQYL